MRYIHDKQGHSLGASYATVCYDQFTETNGLPAKTALGDLYSLASPRLGEQDFAEALKKCLGQNTGSTWRIANKHDAVPKVPPILPVKGKFNHVDAGYLISPDEPPAQLESEIGKDPRGAILPVDFYHHCERFL